MCHHRGKKKYMGITKKGRKPITGESENERKTIICRFVRRTALVPPLIVP